MNDLQRLCLDQAVAAFADRDVDCCLEWLEQVPPPDRPVGLVAGLNDLRSRHAADRSRWGDAISAAETACSIERTPERQERVGLLRKRQPPQSDRLWDAMNEKVDPATRLEPGRLRPTIDEVHACGAYFSRGAGSGAPWSRFLRIGKQPDEEERDGALSLAGGYFARYLLERTSLLASVEVVVPIPANPTRYVGRMMSLPDELAKAAGAVCALPVVLAALAWDVDVELKGLSWQDRRAAMREAFRVGPDIERVRGRAVLLVDDILTSGSTLTAAARLLREVADVPIVSALVLAHTEG